MQSVPILQIPVNDLYGIKVLNDDKHAFPPYDAVILVSGDFAQKNPKAMEALGKLNNRINEDTMRRLNAQYDINGRNAREIAHDFLVSENLNFYINLHTVSRNFFPNKFFPT